MSPPPGHVHVSERQTGKCIIWAGALTQDGYGKLSWNRKRSRLAHRAAWEEIHGPVPIGLELDHLCRVRACVNPDHLEAVTHRENILRGEGIAAQAARQQTCVHGHPFTSLNGKGHRRCATCQAISDRKRGWYPARRLRATTDPNEDRPT